MKFDVHSKLDFAEPAVIRAEQTRLLNEQLEYCRRNSPYYRRLLAKFPAKEISLASLAELPTTSKADLAEHNEEFTALPADRISDISFTSGTTGRPCRICYSADDLVRLGCNDARGYLAAGMRAGDRVLLTCTIDRCFIAGLAYYQGVVKLGAAGIRVFGNRFVGDPEETTRQVIEGIAALIEKTPGMNASVLLEVHGDFHTVESLSPILRAFKEEPRFGLIWDIAHTHPAYGENWKRFYDAIAPFVRHVHIKDARGGELKLPGEGEIPILPIVGQLLRDGYAGAFSLEWEKKWHPELPPVETALERFVALLKTIP